jgi:hypothetical protein
MQQNNICDNDTYCHERIYEANESIVTIIYMAIEHIPTEHCS